MPSTGKIIYWENVSSAASLGIPRQKQNGLQGSISGLLSGEHATDILNGEPSGVFVTFSTGRVVHVAVRDSQGKPTVMAHFLKSRANQSSGGLLGGIKSVLGGGSWRKDVAATRAGESHQRGQRDIMIATSAGLIEIWDTHWNSGSVMKKQFDVKKDVCSSLGTDGMDGTSEQDVAVLDAAYANSEHAQDSAASEEESWPLFLVVASSRSLDSKRLYVVQITLSASETRILSTRPVDLHNIPTALGDTRPRMLVPRVGDTAFIIIGQSVILMSLAPVEETPGLQLLNDSGQLPSPFQDSINFRAGREYEILGAGVEDRRDGGSYPTCLAMVREFGVIRITALPRSRMEGEIEDAKITAKDKLEQAVFYGSMRGNPLNLVSQDGLDFPAQEIEEAALKICRELLQSKSKFIPSAAIPLEQNLRSRAKALDDLASLLMRQRRHFDRMVWWELLWSAEKLAAQRAMWKIEEGCRKGTGKKTTFLAQVIGSMSEKFRTVSDAQDNVDDHVRHWFLYDTYRMEHVVPWIYNAIKAQKGKSSRQAQKMSGEILNASELSLAILETAFQYRDGNATRFGLDEGYFEDGVLSAGYESLPEFWTSQSMSYVETSNLLDLQLDICRAWVQKMGLASEAPDNEILRKIARNCTGQIRVLGQMHLERVRWLSAQGDPGLMDEGVAIEDAHTRQRKWHLFKLAGIGKLGDAISLAEKFRDMTVLAELIVELQDQTKCHNLAHILSKQPDTADNAPGDIGRKFVHYFENFGEAWADAFFTRQISMGQSGTLFAMKNFQPFVTQFLRKDPAYSRLRWINDVVGEHDYDAASKTLKDMATEGESDIWCHHVQLSLSKLTRLASCEKDRTDETVFQDDIKYLENYADIDGVQEVIHAHIQPVLQGAIDQKAEIELAIDCFGKTVAEDRPSLHEVLGDALTKVVTRQVIDPDQLVDLLTLIDLSQVASYDDNDLSGQEFFLALRVIQLSGYRQRDPLYHSSLQKLVWRRCMIRDNWDARGKADETSADEAETSEHDTALFQTLTHCLGESMRLQFHAALWNQADIIYTEHSDESSQSAFYIPRTASELQLSKSESDVLVSRFRPEQQIRIARDLDLENEILCQYLGEGKLEFWFKSLMASARGAVAFSDSPGAVEDSGGDQ